MAKLSRDEVQKREEFARKIFKEKPGISVPEANKLMKARFKQFMRSHRLYILREMVDPEAAATATAKNAPWSLSGPKQKVAKPPKVKVTKAAKPVAPTPTPPTPPQVRGAGRKPGANAIQGTLPLLITINGLDAAEAVEATLDALRTAGHGNMTVELNQGSYLVINRAP